MGTHGVLTVSQAADEAHVSRAHIHRLIQRGELTASKLDPLRKRSPLLIERTSFNKWNKKRAPAGRPKRV